MAQGPSDTILVAIRITLRIRESKVRNPDPPDRRRFVLSEHSFLVQSCDSNAPIYSNGRLFSSSTGSRFFTTELCKAEGNKHNTCIEKCVAKPSVTRPVLCCIVGASWRLGGEIKKEKSSVKLNSTVLTNRQVTKHSKRTHYANDHSICQ